MSLRVAAIIATAIIVITGLTMISPLFLRPHNFQTQQEKRIMLVFSVVESANAEKWCRELAVLLDIYNLPASVFFTGKIAERYPQSVSAFRTNVDVGSGTYSYVNLTGITDYSMKLHEVNTGKSKVDEAADIYTRSFKAPFGAVDQDIYSLLSRSDIFADFSYTGQYNLYQDGKFVKYEAITYEAKDYFSDFFTALPQAPVPIIIFVDNTFPISDIKAAITNLKNDEFEFVNASELTGYTLTARGG